MHMYINEAFIVCVLSGILDTVESALQWFTGSQSPRHNWVTTPMWWNIDLSSTFYKTETLIYPPPFIKPSTIGFTLIIYTLWLKVHLVPRVGWALKSLYWPPRERIHTEPSWPSWSLVEDLGLWETRPFVGSSTETYAPLWYWTSGTNLVSRVLVLLYFGSSYSFSCLARVSYILLKTAYISWSLACALLVTSCLHLY
jgi:hypothetical protein